MTKWVGIDVSKHELAVCVMDEHKQVEQATFANERQGFRSLTNYLKKRKAKGASVCLEATGVYGDELAAYLHERGYRVGVVNPARIKRYAESQLQRNKTDKLDAKVIADFCRTQDWEAWTPPPPEWVELRALVRRLDDVTQMRVQEKQRLESVRSAEVERRLREHIDFLSQQIADLKREIQDHIDQHPDLKRQRDLLETIDGIGPSASAHLLAEIRDMMAFENVRQLVAYVGLNPRQRQSGNYQGQVRISKTGNAALRAALFMPARAAKRHNPLVRGLVERMEREGHKAKSVTVAVMRKLLHYAYGVLKSGLPFDPEYQQQKAQMA